MNKLQTMGWCAQTASQDLDENRLVRISAVHRSNYIGQGMHGELRLQTTGKFQHLALDSVELPVTGDWCLTTEPYKDENGNPAALITECLPRNSSLTRISPKGGRQILAANIDFAFIVSSANQDFSSNRIRRYVLLCREGNVEPIIVCSKIDLVDSMEAILAELNATFPNIRVVQTSTEQAGGMDELRKQLEAGKTYVFLGSSGVGKSSMVNSLLEEAKQATKTIRSEDAKGRHTTTSRELFLTKSGAILIDTPGLREVQVLGSETALEESFVDISALTSECRFSDCQHESEPGCAIQIALESGRISDSELSEWHKLQRELAYANRKVDRALASKEKQKWKRIHQNYRQRKKVFGR